MSLRHLFFSLMCVTAVSGAYAADAERTREDVNREVVRTYAKIYVEQRDFAKAEEVISEYLVREKDEDGILFVQLGEVQMAQRKFPQACHSFQTGASYLKEVSDQVYAKYSLANCYNRGGKVAEAKLILQGVSKDAAQVTNVTDLALQLINSGLIRSGDSLPAFRAKARGRLRVAGAVGTGYDSNVLLVEESVASGTASNELASFFVTPAVQVGYIGRAFNDAYDSRIYTTFTDYINSSVRSFNSLYSRADISFGSGQVRWGLFGDALFLNRNPFNLYSYETGLSWSLLSSMSEEKTTSIEVPIQFQKYILDSSIDSSNDRTGGDIKVRLTKRWMKSEHELLTLKMVLDGQYTSGRNYRLAGLSLPAFWMTSLPFLSGFQVLNTFSAELKGQYYFQSDVSRRDVWMNLGAGLARTFGSSWNVTLDYSAQKNLSNLSAARFSKSVISLQMSHDFF